ncbi:hypothetical protein A2210_02775 [Candidatus Woesebacteria bacterium RIFOXYA1_FULL_40_18]|uniref:Uncharacterized protein n=3 Tax=Candidatus Woeseibacteriota TaxID=1752722 RepID=A0A0G0VK52_9BACT|nr:MAG: hypothetical protein UU03_C0012G0004 [Candidatus Woesebacteria bacterium GW2011_GWA1_40_45]OGM76555.1 MAG: hypothetical protein A2210_02775 [Candidatus Woesebacteria bacterium RIFOXYA1_FULL_40_18]OGM86934.1 MAG: hypothetical protein A2614_01160 [Candidatus Woesebacteria bacterium RIFOXYD1_FULL_40_21]
MALTKTDKIWVKNVLEDALDNQEQKFEAKITEFKDEFFTKIDPILKEVVASREEREILSQHSKNQTDRIEKIENKLGIQSTI